MAQEVSEFIKEAAIANETFDSLAFRLYGEERMSKYIRMYNRQYSDLVMFRGGELLKIPVLTKVESTETLPPWRR